MSSVPLDQELKFYSDIPLSPKNKKNNFKRAKLLETYLGAVGEHFASIYFNIYESTFRAFNRN